jgi:nucleoside-diphosphate-sugar epimerase
MPLIAMSHRSTASESFLVTGALGCLGAWIVSRLLREGTRVVAFDAHDDCKRLRLLHDERDLSRVQFVRGDVADAQQLDAVIDRHGVTHIVHLAALLHPRFKSDPRLGVRVNALGGVNVFEVAARRPQQVQRVVYASSIAVYDAEDGIGGAVPHHLVGRPSTLYGVYKQAEEGMARVYFQDRGLSSIGVRPASVFGAGRDQGLTAGPTEAVLAAAHGKPYHIGYSGRSHLHYTDDLARVFIACARSAFSGADVFNVRGTTATMDEIVAAIEAIAPTARGKITFEGPELALPQDFDDSALQAVIGPVPCTPLADALGQTYAIFRGRRIPCEWRA